MLAAGYPPGILAQAQSWQTLLKKRERKTRLQNIQGFNHYINFYSLQTYYIYM